MAVRNILNKKEEPLRKPTRGVTEFNGKLHQLLDDMWNTMAQEDGVGLAAPQIGILRRIAIVKASGQILELINGHIVESTGCEEGLEGCLSCPLEWVLIDRATKIKVEYQNRQGEKKELIAQGFLARVIQHELDHLDGILMLDKAKRVLNSEELDAYLDERK